MKVHPATLLLDISKDFADHRVRREDSWHGYSDGERGGAIPFAVRSLYRGQNAHHLPMLPSIARGLQSSDIGVVREASLVDQAKIVLRLAQSWWFSRELARHPIALHANRLRVDLDPIALAQHYGIPTGYLDLTDDFNVSAFFATCYEKSGEWQPVSSGEGVIYRVTLDTGFENPFGRYAPLGPQPLPRPSEQCAWVAELPLCHSFDGWPNVSVLHFEHDKHVGDRFLEMFEGGSKLFPPDPLADVASEILSCGAIPSDLVDKALDSFADDPFGLLKSDLAALRVEISKLTTFIEDRRLLTDESLAPLMANQEWREKMLSDVNVRWRAIRRVPV